MAVSFRSQDREQHLSDMEKWGLDVLVVGGGITGAGIALDAASRGLMVGLVDMQDFAAGTSSRSTKLVHGGLRYLKQFDIGLVAEVGKERAIVYENGPHVTTPERMLLPIYKGGTFGRFGTSLGLTVYDFLARVKREERRRILDAEETLALEPLLRKEGLLGGGYYVEYRTDDARLTLEVLKEAAVHGACAVNYARLSRFLYAENGAVAGGEIEDVLTGTVYKVKARCVVNAAGPWVDTLRELDGSKRGKRLQLTKGVHLVVDQSVFPLKQAVYFDTPDGRMMFAIPREGKAYIGTSDTVYTGDLKHPKVTVDDRRYVLNAVGAMFPEVRLSDEDVESSWAGIRPLIFEEGKSPSEISRKDEIWQSASGLVTIAGGKLTGYRHMAETVVNRVVKQLGGRRFKSIAKQTERSSVGTVGCFDKRLDEVISGPIRQCSVDRQGQSPLDSDRGLVCVTKDLPISGGHVGGSAGLPAFIEAKAAEGEAIGLPKELAMKWAAIYGSNVDCLYSIARSYMTGKQKSEIKFMVDHGASYFDERKQGDFWTDLPLGMRVPLIYAIEYEMAVTPADFFIRRTGALLFRIEEVHKWRHAITLFMGVYLGWSEQERELFIQELDERLREATMCEGGEV